MRAIKFRGKRIDNGEWVYGYYYFDSHINKATITYFDYEGFMCEDEVFPETVGEYTGLLDKNGKELFEGDIILISYDNFKRKTPVIYYCGVGFLDLNNSNEKEVIGNIFENPELLEGK